MRLSIRPLALATLLPAVAAAFQPLVTDDTGTQGAGGNQIEAAYNRTVDKVSGARIVTQEMPLVFTRGVTDALDLYAGIGYQRIAPAAPAMAERGFGNSAVGAKWRFFEDDANKLSFALKPEIRFPVSDNREARGLGTARASYSFGLLMTQETGFGAVHANLMADRANYSDEAINVAERRNLYRLSVAPVWDVARGWKLALDAGLMTNPDRAARARMGYVELGAIYSPGKDLDLAAGIIRNVGNGDVQTWQATAGFTWRFR
jgi:hypothetical protein